MKSNMQSRELDADIRLLAKEGQGDGAHINYTATWEDCEIRATFGAGTNSAALLHNGMVLYEAANYGNHITEFHEGPWIERLQAAAKRLREKRKLEAEERNRREREAHEARFTPTDF